MAFDNAGVKALLFDLDGTLIDSSADLAASGNWLRASRGLPAHNLETVAGFIGDGVEALVRRLLERPDGSIEAEVEAFKAHYHEHCLDQTRLYAGVAETLRALQRPTLRMAVVTNKPVRISRHILEGLGVAAFFGSVIGGNSCANKKPHPEPLLKACSELGCTPGEALMIGDSRVDIEAGKNAGMRTVGCLGASGMRRCCGRPAPDLIVESFESLAKIL